MLNIFRNKGLSSIVYGAIIVAMALVFVIQFRPNAAQRTASVREACAGRVRGFCIDPKSQKASYRMLIPRDQGGNLLTGRAKSMGLSRIALDGLIERELLVAEGDRLGLTVSEDEITKSIYDGFIRVSLPSDNPQLAGSLGVREGYVYAGFKDTKTKEFDMKVYERSVRALTGRSPQEFREWQARELLAAKVRDLVRAPVRVSDAEAYSDYVTEKSSAQVVFVPVRQSWVEKYLISATDAQVSEWAKDKSNASQVGEPMIRHILIKPEPGGTAAESKDAAKKKAELLVARLKKGDDFAALAKEFSKDPGSGARGGELGEKTDGFVEPFKVAADGLKAGQMTEKPVETQFGFHIIKKDEPARAAYVKAKSLELSREIALKVQAAAKAKPGDQTALEEAVKGILAEVSKTAPKKDTPKKEPKATDKAAGDAGSAPTKEEEPKTLETDDERPTVQTSQSFNKTGDPVPSIGLEGAQKITDFAFKGKEGDTMTEPLRSEDGFTVIVIKQKKGATRDEYDKDRDTFVATLLARKQAEALSLYVKRLREAAKEDIKVDETYLIDGKPDGGAPAPQDEDDEGP